MGRSPRLSQRLSSAWTAAWTSSPPLSLSTTRGRPRREACQGGRHERRRVWRRIEGENEDSVCRLLASVFALIKWSGLREVLYFILFQTTNRIDDIAPLTTTHLPAPSATWYGCLRLSIESLRLVYFF